MRRVKAFVDGQEQEFRGARSFSPPAPSIRRRISCAPASARVGHLRDLGFLS